MVGELKHQISCLGRKLHLRDKGSTDEHHFRQTNLERVYLTTVDTMGPKCSMSVCREQQNMKQVTTARRRILHTGKKIRDTMAVTSSAECNQFDFSLNYARGVSSIKKLPIFLFGFNADKAR